MARFVELKDSNSGAPLAVNPDHVTAVIPQPDLSEKASLIWFSDGRELSVEGRHSDIVKKLVGT